MKPDTLVLMDPESWAMLFDQTRRRRLQELSSASTPVWLPSLDEPGAAPRLPEVEILLTGWGAPLLDAAALDRFPKLRAVLHCGGSVRPVVTPAVWDRGIVVSSSADLNADPVAEFTLAAVVMAGKKVPFLAAEARRYRQDWSYRGKHGPLSNDGLTIGVVGFSRIGRRVVDLAVDRLREVTVLVADPYADVAEVAAAGATLVDLEDMLPRLDILSIHAPDLPSTRHMIAAPQLAALPDHSTVINTARGALIDTAALTAECAEGRLHAILDVTDPEPLPPDSLLYELPNVMLTPHVAGSLGSETHRMADGALDELQRLLQGRPLMREVFPASLTISA